MSAEPTLGYSFDPPCAPSHPGYRQLRVWLRAVPTERHYDPENVRLFLALNNGMEVVTLNHPALPPFTARVCIGRIHLTDRMGKHVDAFTFGGDAQFTVTSDTTALLIQSPAPIFALLPSIALASEIVDAVESVLAEQRAQWDMRYSAIPFEERLAALPPFSLYLACLSEMEENLRPLIRLYEPAQHIHHFIAAERRELQAAGRWPARVATFAELVG